MTNYVNKEEPLVSIVVNNYNKGLYLRECLEHLISQTYNNIEIILVDALSTDDSRKIIKEFSSKDSRILPILSEKYIKYPAISYNLGFLSSRGKYIAINDPDDYSFPDRIRSQVDFLEKNESVDAVGCECLEISPEGKKTVSCDVAYNIMNASPPVRNPVLMFRKLCLAKHGMWNWKKEYAADFEWLYRWYASGVKFGTVEGCFVMYRAAYGKNISSQKALNQAKKLVSFRIFYGIILFGKVGWKWWLKTASTFIYVLILIAKKNKFLEYSIKRIKNVKK